MTQDNELRSAARRYYPCVSLPAIDWQDREQVERWFEALRETLLDGLAAGKDATQRFKQRLFSRHEAQRRIEEAERVALGLLEAGHAGLPQRPEVEKPTSSG